MRIRSGSELEDMSIISNERLRFLRTIYHKPENKKQKFIHDRIEREVWQRVKIAAYSEETL